MKQFIKQLNDQHLLWQDKVLPCRVGRSGFSTFKQEGDGCTPTGTWKLLTVYYRPDKMVVPKTKLPIVEITPHMGWSDDPFDPFYNTCITMPCAFSHEKLWREDNLYDLFITTSHNTDPIIPECGSAIFIHQMRETMTPTEGCLALKFEDLMRLVETANLDTHWVVGEDLGYIHSA